MKFQSACWLANRNVIDDLLISLQTFDLFHRMPIYVGCDKVVKQKLSGFRLPRCPIFLDPIIPQMYSEVVSHGPDFRGLVMLKMNVMGAALRRFGSTMIFDTDIFFLQELNDIDLVKHQVVLNRLGLKDAAAYGIYSAGYVGANTVSFPSWWRKAAERGHHYEQDALDTAPKYFRCQELPFQHNFFGGRLDHAPTEEEVKRRYGAFSVKDTVLWDGKPLMSVHISARSKEWLPSGKPVGGFFGMVIGFLEQSKDPRHKKVLELVRP